jgi:cell division protein FtsX
MPGQYGLAPYFLAAIFFGLLGIVVSILSIITNGWRVTIDSLKDVFKLIFDSFTGLFRKQ